MALRFRRSPARAAAWLLLGRLLLVGWLLGGLLGPAVAATSEDAKRAYENGDFAAARSIWIELSKVGKPEANFGLGLLYDLGNGTPPDAEVAFYWYRKAAESGLSAAEFNVATMYDSGRGVARSTVDAAIWYARAAAHGHHRAQFNLGLLYQAGQGVPRNPDAAAAWFRVARDGGVAAAASRLTALGATKQHRPTGGVAPVALAFPARDATVTVVDDNRSVTLVWVVLPQPEPVQYVVQVRQIGESDMQTVVTEVVDETAILVRLPSDKGFYAWSVDAIGPNGAHAVSDWSWFSTVPAPVPPSAVASAPLPADSER